MRDLLVGRRDASAPVDDKDDGAAFVEREVDLLLDKIHEGVFRLGHNAARVDDVEFLPRPFGLTVEPVSGNAGLVVNDRRAFSKYPVEY